MDNTYYLTTSYMAGNKLNENLTSLKKRKKLFNFITNQRKTKYLNFKFLHLFASPLQM